MSETQIVAWISVLLYGSVFLISGCFFFTMHCTQVKDTERPVTTMGKSAKVFAERCKKFFFVILSLSAACDIPFYSACIAKGYPTACLWPGQSEDILLSFHLLSIWGYTVILGIPLYLWSEIIHGPDENIIAKRFLMTAIVLYTIVIGITMAGTDDKSQYLYNGIVSTYLESIFMVMIACGWLVLGIRLQIHVLTVKFGRDAERRILFLVNLVLLAVTVSFLIRAVFVGLRHSGYITEGVDFSYVLWAVLTRWTPHVFCSYLMLYIFRKSEQTVRKQRFGDAYGARRRQQRANMSMDSSNSGRENERMSSKWTAHYSLESSESKEDILLPLFGEPQCISIEDDSDDMGATEDGRNQLSQLVSLLQPCDHDKTGR